MDNNFLAFRNDFVREFELSMSGNKKTDDPLSRKIVSFGNLPKGWDFGAGYPVNNAVISIALTLYNLFKSFGFNELNTDAIPHADSGITLSFSRGDEFFDISIGGNFIIDTTWEKGFGQEYDIIAEHENVKLVDVYKQMIGFLRETSKCNLFGYSTSASITPKRDDSNQMHSPFFTMEFPFSKPFVHVNAHQTAFAPISQFSTKYQPDLLWCIG